MKTKQRRNVPRSQQFKSCGVVLINALVIMNLISERRIDSSRFTSYIHDGNFEIDLSTVQEHRRKLLEGEQLIHQSQNVVLYEQLCNPKVSHGLTGLLTITTFKLSFTPSNGVDDNVIEYCQNSSLLGPYEVCLSAIDTIYHVTGSNSSARKKLSPCQNVSGKVKELQIVCKNMRVLWLSFKKTDKDSGRQVTNTLLHHVYPKRHSLLFAYDFPAQQSIEPTSQFKANGSTHIDKTRLFRSVDDWQGELERTSSNAHWRITLLNETFDPCPHLPRYLVVPRSVTDSHLLQSLRSFRNEVFPVWTWGIAQHEGVGLVRMAELLLGITDRTQENTMLEKVRESHPNKRAPEILYLDRDCPSPSQVRQSYLRLRDLCTPITYTQLRTQDARFYSLLEGSRWLHYVSMCLKVSMTAVRIITGQVGGGPRTVVLQEGNGQDMNCVVAGLIQVLLDPYARTMHGFQSLLQKEWIAMGHPFSSRLGHTYSPDAAEAQSPLLLLFLDCVYQITLQFPLAFQYTSTYLCTVWDSAHLTAYETFLFNSEHARVLAERDKGAEFRSAWEWSEQFPRQRDVNMFCNPLYHDAATDHLIQFKAALQYMEIWTQCYFRWLPSLEIRLGGEAHADVAMRFIANEIVTLDRQIKSTTPTKRRSEQHHLANGAILSKTEEDAMLDYLSHVNSFFPFSVDHLDNKDDATLVDNDVENQPDIDTQSRVSS